MRMIIEHMMIRMIMLIVIILQLKGAIKSTSYVTYMLGHRSIYLNSE